MKWPVEKRLLRLPGAALASLPAIYIAMPALALSSNRLELSLFPWLLVGSYLFAPVIGRKLVTEFSLDWGRVTAILPIAASVRVMVIWWRRVAAPTILVWIANMLYPLVSPVDSLSWDTALQGLSIPFVGSAGWFLLAASSGAGYWTHRSAKPTSRGSFQGLRYIAFLAFPFALAVWIDLEQAQYQFSMLFLLLGAVMSALGVKQLHSQCLADAMDSAELRPTMLQATGPLRLGRGLSGFKPFALDYLQYGVFFVLIANLFFHLPFKFMEILLDLPFVQIFGFILFGINPAMALVLIAAHLYTKLPLLRALRTLPLDASRISLRVTVLVVLPLLLSSVLTTVFVLLLYGSQFSLQTFLFSIGGAGIASCTIVPCSWYLTSDSSFSRELLAQAPAIAAFALWIAGSELLFAGNLPLIAPAVAAIGIWLTWKLIRDLISRSSRVYRTNNSLAPTEEWNHL